MYKQKINSFNKIKNSKILIFSKSKISKKLNYDNKQSIEFYNNFLNWLFKTFKTNEKKFRSELFSEIKFKNNQKILITGVGKGDDAEFLNNLKKKNLKIYLQDLSHYFILHCYNRFKNKKNFYYTISDAKDLPFKDSVFDHVFHFGGINLFGNIRKSIDEMFRVAKNKGTISFGDEGVAPWLRNSVYADMMINNNNLWKKRIPINSLPFKSDNVIVKWLLGNCFYFITFKKNEKFPNVNFNVRHKSPRGGSILSRYKDYKGIKKKINIYNKK